jgi:membrane-bound ClpP family serine protease
MDSPPVRASVSGFVGSFRRLAANVLIATIVATIPPAAAAERALVLQVDGVIGPAVADYVVRELQTAKAGEVGLVVLRMNTPGGLDTSMRQIISAILASPVPIATYVAPNGGRAASAGTYIAYASAIAAMAPSTNIGAATPVRIGPPSFLPGADPNNHPGRRMAKTKASHLIWVILNRGRPSMMPSPISAASPTSTAATRNGPRSRCVRRLVCLHLRHSRNASST